MEYIRCNKCGKTEFAIFKTADGRELCYKCFKEEEEAEKNSK